MSKLIRFFVATASIAVGAPVFMIAAELPSQQITTTSKVKIPGSDLEPGQYTFAVEDRLQDRAIVRITSRDGKHYLVLTVPNTKLEKSTDNGLTYFVSDKGKEIVRAWSCPGCAAPLEFVYPKAEAAKITDGTAQSVLAVDPSSDKLPLHLSEDDMKVVTLWLLSPERITGAHKGSGVAAEKYVGVEANGADRQAPAPVTAQNNTPPNPPNVEMANAEAAPSGVAPSNGAPSSMARRRSLPHTASNTFLFALAGLLLMLAASALRLSRRVWGK